MPCFFVGYMQKSNVMNNTNKETFLMNASRATSQKVFVLIRILGTPLMLVCILFLYHCKNRFMNQTWFWNVNAFILEMIGQFLTWIKMVKKSEKSKVSIPRSSIKLQPHQNFSCSLPPLKRGPFLLLTTASLTVVVFVKSPFLLQITHCDGNLKVYAPSHLICT